MNSARHVIKRTGGQGESLVPPYTCGIVSLARSYSQEAKKRGFKMRLMTRRTLSICSYRGDGARDRGVRGPRGKERRLLGTDGELLASSQDAN